MTPPNPGRRRILIVGATGTLGGAVLRELQNSGARLRVLVRRRQPTMNAEIDQIVGDLNDETAVRRALTGVDAAFYVSPHEEHEVEMAQRFVRLCEELGVRIIFAGVHVSARSLAGRCRLQLFRLLIPAYRPKLRIGQLIEHGATNPVLFCPANFMDNDLMFLDDIRAGTFPTPLRGANRVAVTDIAVLCRKALLNSDFPAGSYDVSGPEALTGTQCAQIWGEVLGRPVMYTGTDSARWGEVADQRLPPEKKGRDFRNSFRMLGKISVGTNARALQQTTELLGRPPMTLRQWAQQVVTTRETASCQGIPS